MLSKMMMTVSMTLALVFAAGCSSEDDPGRSERVAGTPTTPAPDDCVERCAPLAGCELMNDETCEAACEQASVADTELACLIRSECDLDAFGACFDILKPNTLGRR